MALDLPAEVLTQIFSLAADEDLLFQYALPTSLANSSWFKHIAGDWSLRTPQEAGNLLMRRSYKTKKSLMLVCKQWHNVAYELLFRCLFFNTPLKLFEVVKILDSQTGAAATESSLGWWTRRVHVCRYSAQELEGLGISLEDMQWALLTIIRHCPNLEIFHVDWPMKGAFGEVASALYNHAYRSLRVVHFNVPRTALSKVIWALNALPYIVAAHIEFEPGPARSIEPDDDEESVHLGSASDYQVNLKYLYQLSIVGFAREFLEQATEWLMPSLKVFSYNTGSYTGAVPEAILNFLKIHGDTLEFLDLDTYLPLEIANILDQCPQVTTFAFNADCRITPHNDTESEIVHRPRPNIHTIGLHGLSLAFGVGAVVAAKNPAIVRLTQKSNDLNMAALNRRNFPNLQRIRALSRPMLLDLNRAGQPNEENGGMARWANWWDTCALAGIALEDCTGDSLGNLPELPASEVSDEEEEGDSDEYEYDSDEYDEEDEEEESDEDEDDDDDDDDDSSESDDENILPAGWKKLIPPMPEENQSARTRELRQLLKECRAMERQRDREAPLLPPAFMMMMGAGGGMPGFGMPEFPGTDIPTAMGGRGFGFGGSR